MRLDILIGMVRGWKVLKSARLSGMANPRQLSPGIDYSLWPQLKWSRARQLVSELNSRIELWSTSVPRGLIAEISEDRMSVVYRARLPNAAPVFEWSLLLADILHNYRTALDALAWEMAHLEGNKPSATNERKIYFPITTTRAAWLAQARGSLSSVPEDVLERMHSVQPYGVEPVSEGIFLHLHELDIADKHKGLIRAAVSVRDKRQVEYAIALESGESILEHLEGDPWTWLASSEPASDGDPIFEVRTDAPIAEASSRMRLPVAITVENRGVRHDVMNLLVLIDQQVALTFEVIETGSFADALGLRPVPVEHLD
ncbi:hypothetical protein E3O42_00395 [Cryobacterium adonitolivorans]|uniref:Uncharacterized protein n=1 Tax=Cryobacterium adonitolivorans TaxID=1259189 RepID=A0A4R8WFD3_9MICO|nr:hypothetical protein [Cryobacterium adonitolivorans]TFC06888.1 hypothetical protein E3O42_00395 [Cryobacterium adonitolivorans]